MICKRIVCRFKRSRVHLFAHTIMVSPTACSNSFICTQLNVFKKYFAKQIIQSNIND